MSAAQPGGSAESQGSETMSLWLVDCSQFSVSLAVVLSLSNRHKEGLRLFPTLLIKTCI